ncbi:unnamed protein product [Moneuplotes crassus]|uniref:Uncharacterized protein n=1 Tax=Euplotes crassus TaxID=5936 RepID=A0AAD1XT91_EUPCR|nr:unnamed protein product [Moneuplotes crassus]
MQAGATNKELKDRLRHNLVNNIQIRDAMTRTKNRVLSQNTRRKEVKSSMKDNSMSNRKYFRNSRLILDNNHSVCSDRKSRNNKAIYNINVTTVYVQKNYGTKDKTRIRSPDPVSNNSSIVSPPPHHAGVPKRNRNKKLIIRGDYKNPTTCQKNKDTKRSVSPFPGSSISGISTTTKGIDPQFIRKLANNKKIVLPSDVMSSPKSTYSRKSLFKKVYPTAKKSQYDYNKEICPKDEDFSNIYTTEMEYRKDLTKLLEKSDPSEEKLRENLICKIKKICDEYELSDDTFFRTIFLYDFNRRVVHSDWEENCLLENKPLKDLFIFGEGEAGDKKLMQYGKFFDILSCLTICVKYYEHERESPGLIHILKFFRMEKLAVKIKTDEPEIKNMTDISSLILDIIYEYICEKQMEILFRINWKMQIVNPKHFIDHYIRVLPSLKILQLIATKQKKILNTEEAKEKNYLDNSHPSKDLEYSHGLLREEIEDCIYSITKLSPLVPSYIEYNSAEVASAALTLSIKHSVKTILNEGECNRADVEKLKALYSRWTSALLKKNQLSKDRVAEFCVLLEVFLTKVSE